MRDADTAADDGTPIRSATSLARRRAEGRRRMFLVSGIGGAVLVVAVVVAVLLAGGGRRGRIGDDLPRDPLGVNPRPHVEGVEWSHKQVADYLNRRGMRIEVKNRSPGTMAEFIPQVFASHVAQGVIVWRCDSPAQAAALQVEHPGSFSWGSYNFDGGDGSTRKEIATLLGVRYP